MSTVGVPLLRALSVLMRSPGCLPGGERRHALPERWHGGRRLLRWPKLSGAALPNRTTRATIAIPEERSPRRAGSRRFLRRLNGAHVVWIPAITLPPTVIVLFPLLALALLDGARLLTNRTVRV